MATTRKTTRIARASARRRERDYISKDTGRGDLRARAGTTNDERRRRARRSVTRTRNFEYVIGAGERSERVRLRKLGQFHRRRLPSHVDFSDKS